MIDRSLWNRILWYISKRERCEKEIREHLARISKFKFQISSTEIEEIITKLKSLDFLNEDRFTKAYVHDNYELKHKGKSRIRQELKHRKIDEVTIDKYLSGIDVKDEEKQAFELAKKRHELIKNLPILTQKRRLFGTLVRRGFPTHLALKVIDEILQIR